MRILFVTPGFSADESDWCIPVLLHLVRELAARHEVDVLALRHPAPARSYRVYGARVHTLGFGRTAGLARIGLVTQALRWIRAVEPRPDVFHGLWADEPGAVSVLAARMLRRPALVSLMGGELVALRDIGYGQSLRFTSRFLVERSLAGAHRVTVGTRSMEDLAAAHVDGERLRRWALGVDTDLFAATERQETDRVRLAGSPRLLSVASLVPVKDHELQLRALQILAPQMPEVRLHLVGEGTERGRLESLVQDLGLREHVTFHGHVRHDLLPAFYRAADLHVLSSRHESQCMAVLEAAACGTPTVGVGVGVLAELPPPARAVVGRTPAALAEGIVNSMAEVSREARRDAALSVADSRYELRHSTRALESIYEDLLGLTA